MLGLACCSGSSSSAAGLGPGPAEPAPAPALVDEFVAASQPGFVPVVPTTGPASIELHSCKFPNGDC